MTRPDPPHDRGRPPARPELLAPAGSEEALRAAINNGADAVYLGLSEFNARRGAENFSLDALREACRFAHLRGRRVYLTANVLVLPEEMQAALDTVDAAWAAGVDAVIMQDMGLMQAVHRNMPDVRIHASTQVGCHNVGTAALLEDLGVSRITLARETTLDEIAELAAASSAEIETFVHGALCVCYSGQCLMSSVIGRRSGNRGLCAQPCRLPYALVRPDGEAAETPGPYVLSPRDLLGLESLPALVRAGVAALKIEGRMKSPEYVALVTGVYRAALDRAIEDPDGFAVRDAEIDVLEEAFSRGFSAAYLEGIRDSRMMSYSRPNNRGVRVGRVASLAGSRVDVVLERPLDADDVVEVWTARSRVSQRVGELTLEGASARSAPAGQRVRFEIEGRVGVGDRVFRVVNAALQDGARRTFAAEGPAGARPVDLRVRAVEGLPLLVEISDGALKASAEGSPVERARTKPLTAEEVVEHVGRFGGTSCSVRTWDIELQAGVGASYSELHRVRRAAVTAFEREVLRPWTGRERRGVSLSPTGPPGALRRDGEPPRLVAWCMDPELAPALISAGADRVVVPAWALGDTATRQDVVPELPRVAHEHETGPLLSTVAEARVVVVGNLGMVRALAADGREVEGHWGLNVTNPQTASVLADAGAGFLWLSPELAAAQVAGVAVGSPVPVGVAVYGRQEVMVTEHCILMAEGRCAERCEVCARRAGWRVLRDAKGYEFPVTSDASGRSHVFNAVTLELSRSLREVLATGVAALRLDFTTESRAEAQQVVRSVRSRLLGALAGEDPPARPLVQPATAGHFFRGVM